jgi:hypothetical protein
MVISDYMRTMTAEFDLRKLDWAGYQGSGGTARRYWKQLMKF